MAGWALHNTAAAVLLATAATWAALSITMPLSADPVQVAPSTTSDSPVVEIPRMERSRADLAGVASLFGLTVEGASAADEMSPQQHVDAPWQNYASPVLVGVGLLPDRRLAILRLASGQTRVFTEGEQWEEFTVTRVLAGSVHLERSDSTRILSLVRNP
jgi:hypothetical protein